MRIVIVDDEPYFVNRLVELIKAWGKRKYGRKIDIVTYDRFEDAFAEKVGDNDIFILDIADRQNENAGLELAEEIRLQSDSVHIVFLTSYGEKIRDTLKKLIRPSEFLLKPLGEEERDRLYELLEMLAQKDKNRYIELSAGGMPMELSEDDILYIIRENRKTSVYTVNSYIQLRRSFSSVMEMLDDRFVVVDKGTAVNWDKVRAYDPENRILYLENRKGLYCSRERARQLKDRLHRLEVR